MKLPRLLVLTAASLLASAPAPAFAGLISATVTGAFTIGGINYFNPANGFVPAGYGNSSPGSNVNVGISGSITEFGYGDGATDPIFANFTDTQLIISSTYLLSISGYLPWQMTFSSTAFSGQSFSLVSQTYTPGLTASLVGNLITINWAGGSVTNGQTMQATYNIGTVGASDGGATVLLLAGALLALAAGQRRLKLAC